MKPTAMVIMHLYRLSRHILVGIIVLSVLFVSFSPCLAEDELSSHGATESRGTVSADSSLVSGTQSTIVFSARDSLRYAISLRTMDLWGKASIASDNMSIDAPRIVVDYSTSSLNAYPSKDDKGDLVEKPVFADKKGSFEAEEITYNFSTREGLTENISSETDEGYYSGEEVTRLENGELLVKNGFFTTCPKDDPDFWFYSRDMRIIPNDRIVARPLIMYIHPVLFSQQLPPIPLLALPYMVIPLRTDRSSGFLIPRAGNDDDRGFYLSNLGYFWAFNDYTDLRLEGDLALNGSWRIGERFRYNKRYLYHGTLEAEFERYLNDSDESKYDNWFVNLEHHQEFDPTARLDLDLEYQGGNRYYDVNSIDSENIITEQASSYASFSKTYNEGRQGFTLSYQGVQDLTSDDVTQTLSAAYFQSRVYPFSSGSNSPDDWRSRFSLIPRADATIYSAVIDEDDYWNYRGNMGLEMAYLQDFSEGFSARFTQGIHFQGQFDDSPLYGIRRGAKLELPLGVQSRLFRYLNLNASILFNNYYQDGVVTATYDDGDVVTSTTDERSHFSSYGVELEAETRLYGTLYSGLLRDLAGIKALRHTLIPTLSFTWNPDFTSDDFGYYGRYYDESEGAYVRYNRFMDALYSEVPGPNCTVGLGLQNLFQAKMAGDPKKSSDRVVQLLSFDASTAYNFAADSLKLAPLVLSASSNALSPNLLFSAGAVYDFYSYDAVSGDRINTFYADDGGGLLRFVKGFMNMSLNVNGYFRSGNQGSAPTEILNAVEGDNALATSVYKERFRKKSHLQEAYRLPWQLRLSLYLNSDHENPLEPADTDALLNTSARIGLSNIWQLGVNTGYDIENGDFVFPQINLYGDFNCWEMGFEWIPSGEYQSYFFQIGIKSPQLKDLRFRQRGRIDTSS